MRHRFVGRGWHDCWHGFWAGPVSAIFLVYYLNFCNIAVSVQIHDTHLHGLFAHFFVQCIIFLQFFWVPPMTPPLFPFISVAGKQTDGGGGGMYFSCRLWVKISIPSLLSNERIEFEILYFNPSLIPLLQINKYFLY